LNSSKVTTDKFERLTNAFAVCEEFCYSATMNGDGKIVVFVHEKWRSEMERILKRCGFRCTLTKPWGPFRILTLVDSYR
jgi:hypothetical protein